MKDILEREALPEVQLKVLQKALGSTSCMLLGLQDIDLTAGAGILEDGTKCIWRKDGRRVEVFMAEGIFGAALSREPDPDYQPGLFKNGA